MSGFLSPAKLAGFPFSPILHRGEGARRADEGRKIINVWCETAPHPTLAPMMDRGEEYLPTTRSAQIERYFGWGGGGQL